MSRPTLKETSAATFEVNKQAFSVWDQKLALYLLNHQWKIVTAEATGWPCFVRLLLPASPCPSVTSRRHSIGLRLLGYSTVGKRPSSYQRFGNMVSELPKSLSGEDVLCQLRFLKRVMMAALNRCLHWDTAKAALRWISSINHQ